MTNTVEIMESPEQPVTRDASCPECGVAHPNPYCPWDEEEGKVAYA